MANVALGKPANQSSLSHWSSRLGAQGLVNGDFNQDFGFHTDIEDAPWWRVDLLHRLPLDAITVYNRRDIFQERARSLKIEISDNGTNWTVIHAGLCHFGHASDGRALHIPLGGRLWGRYVRLSLTEQTYFHLSQMEVLADASEVQLIAIRELHNLDVEIVDERPGVGIYQSYALNSADNDILGPLVGLELSENGAFGNCMIQYCNAIMVAKRLKLPYIKVSECDRSELIRLHHPVMIDDITILPADELLPSGGVFLRGYFFNSGPFRRALGDVSPAEAHTVIKRSVRRLFNVLPEIFASKPEDELLIHIRSGDIFRNWINPAYVQPPLSYYVTIVDKLVTEGVVRKVKLVFENRLNPVIDPLEAFLQSRNVPFSTQSGSVADDIQALVNGRYMVFGLGTFGPAICHLSDRVKLVFFFSPGAPAVFGSIPTVEQALEVTDGAGSYIQPGEWRNTPEQRDVMVTYPAGNLVFRWPSFD